MKHFALVFLTSLLFSCEQGDCCVSPPEASQLNGTWELVKITNGFAQLEISGDEIGFKEILEIKASQGTFSRKRDGKELLRNKFSIGREANREAILLTDDKSYHWYTLQEKNGELVLSLYENCPIGAVLADGSYYEYHKVE